MTERKKDRFHPPALGGASLLTVFAALCLTIFALLSLASVQADRRLGNASAQAVADYYAADCKAQAVLALLRAGDLPEGVEVTGALARYTVPISDTQELQVEVVLDRLLLDQDTDGYHIQRWQAQPVGAWDTDDSLHLWDGGEL